MAKAQELLYAVVGAGDLAVEKVRGVRVDRRAAGRVYNDAVKRGRTLTTKITNSKTTKQTIARARGTRKRTGSTKSTQKTAQAS